MVGWVSGIGCQILLELAKFGQKVAKIGQDLVGFGQDLTSSGQDLIGSGWILLDRIVILPKFMYMINWVRSPASVLGGKDPRSTNGSFESSGLWVRISWFRNLHLGPNTSKFHKFTI